jgi:hypothetical protein
MSWNGFIFLNHTSLYEYKDNGQVSECNFSIENLKIPRVGLTLKGKINGLKFF